MTEREFLSKTHFMTDNGTVLSQRPRYCTDGAEVIPADIHQQERRNAAAAKLRQEARIAAKLGRVVELLDTALREQQAARRNMGVGSFPGAPSADEMAAQWRREYAAREAQICAEAKAAYDAQNPHKRKEGAR